MADKEIKIPITGDSSGFKKAIGEAETSLGKFAQKVKEADGAGAKFKAGFAGVKDQVMKHAGLLAIGAGASLVEFGVKSVEAFEHTAIAARDLGTATGLTVESASKWIGVAKDMNVNADGLTSGLGKVAKTLDSGKWEKYGIETRDASGHIRDVNDILLDTFTKLSQTTNETERATMGNALFGKGFASISPLIGHTRDEYEKMLGSVEKGQIITEGELKKAEKAEQAQKQLGQAFKESGLAVGQFLSQFIPLLTVLTKGVTFVSNLVSSFIDLAGGVDLSTESFKKFFEQADKATTVKAVGDELHQMSKAADESHNALSRLTTNLFDSRWDNVNEVFKKMGKESPEAMRAVYEELVRLKEAADNGDPAAQKLAADYEINTKHLASLYDAYVRVTPAVAETNRETAKSSATFGQATLSADEQAAALDAAAASQKAYTDAALAANRELVASEVGLVKAQQDEKDMLAGVANAARAAIDAKWAYNESLLATNKTIETSNATLKDHKSTINDDATAVNAARDAAIDTAGAYATMNQHTLDSKAGLEDQIKSLNETATALAPNSPIRASILAYVSDLQGVVAAYTAATAAAYAFRDSGLAGTHHDSYTPGVVANLAPIVAGANKPSHGFAAGGYVPATPGGAQVTVAEAGQGEYMIPENQMSKVGGGTTIVNLTAPGLTENDLVRMLRKFEQHNGKAWRS